MSMIINTNVDAIFAQNALTLNNQSQTQAMQQLSTGSQINNASDNAAGLSISQTMTSQINGLGQAIDNANDAINMLQTADASMSTQSTMLQTMRTLAIQATTGTYSASQRTYMNDEYQNLAAQVTAISSQTSWNNMTLLNGKIGSGTNTSQVTFQVGANSGDTITATITSTSLKSLMGGVSSVGSLLSVSSANSTLALIDTALAAVNSTRANIGGVVNQLTFATDNLNAVKQNETASRSQITDTDYAKATTNLAKDQIISQAASAMLAQANQEGQNVLSILKSA